MDPKEKEKMAEELNVEETKDTAEEQAQGVFLSRKLITSIVSPWICLLYTS